MKNFPLSAPALLAGYIGLSVGILSPGFSVGDPDSGVLIYVWIAATLLLLQRLLSGSASLPALLRPLRLLLVIMLIAMLVPGVLAAIAKRIFESSTVAVDCGPKLRYVALYKGGFGSTWFDVIEMKQVLPMVYTTRALKQYERETVEALRCLNGSGVEVRLGEYGQPERTERLGL